MDNETEEREIERVDSENEGVDSENEGVDNESPHPYQKGYRLRNTPTINYNYGRSNRRSIEWQNLIVGSHALHSESKAYINVLNAITTFVGPIQSTNINTNDIILTHYSIE